jgi:hypothetical protein
MLHPDPAARRVAFRMGLSDSSTVIVEALRREEGLEDILPF